MEGNPEAALDFLVRWGTPYVLTAIDPNTKHAQTTTYQADQQKAVLALLRWFMGKRNLYFLPNRSDVLDKKATKQDIKQAVCFHVDVDPTENQPLEAEQKQILFRLQSYHIKPSVIIFSGNGYQAFWRLEAPFLITSPKDIEAVESRNRKLAFDLGGDKCHNIDRIMRIPGTLNIPTPQKAAKGRVIVAAQEL